MFRILVQYLYSLIGLVAAIITIVLYSKNYLGNLSDDGKLAVIFVGFLTGFFFFEGIYLKIKWGRNARYAEALPLINNGFEQIHQINRNDSPSPEEVLTALERLCTQMAQAFTTITGSRCSVCIKILAEGSGENSNRLKVTTLCRDTYSKSRRDYPEDTIEHWIEENSDFLYILENLEKPKGKYFFSNQLPYKYGYQNSSFRIWNSEALKESSILLVRDFLRYWRWPLPYKSTIVVPICPAISKERIRKNLVGFLCVDSSKMLAFKKDYDVSLMMGVADGLFNIITKFRNVI